MAIVVKVPKNLAKIKTKLVFNLTARQLICFSLAGLAGVPLYLMVRKTIGTDLAALLMVAVMMPFFIFAFYEKDGMPAEQVTRLAIRQKYLAKGIRKNKTENRRQVLEEREAIRKEVEGLERKAGKRKQTRTKDGQK